MFISTSRKIYLKFGSILQSEKMSSFDSDNDFIQDDYYETNGNFYSTNGIYQGEQKMFGEILSHKKYVYRGCIRKARRK